MRANGDLRGKWLDRFAAVDGSALETLEAALRAGRLSARGANRVRAVARTIADLAEVDAIQADHVALAMSLRVDPFVVPERAAS